MPKEFYMAKPDDQKSCCNWFMSFRSLNAAIIAPVSHRKVKHFSKLLGTGDFQYSTCWFLFFKPICGIICHLICSESADINLIVITSMIKSRHSRKSNHTYYMASVFSGGMDLLFPKFSDGSLIMVDKIKEEHPPPPPNKELGIYSITCKYKQQIN